MMRAMILERTATLADGGTPIVHFDVRRNGVAVGSGGLLVSEPVRTHFTDRFLQEILEERP